MACFCFTPTLTMCCLLNCLKLQQVKVLRSKCTSQVLESKYNLVKASKVLHNGQFQNDMQYIICCVKVIESLMCEHHSRATAWWLTKKPSEALIY